MTTKLKGSHPWLVILCKPSDAALPPWPARDYFVKLISEPGAGGLYDYWSQISGQRLNLMGSRVLGWYSLTQTITQINDLQRSGAAAVAREAATMVGEDLSGYRNTLAFFAGSNHFGAQNLDVAADIRVTHGQPGWRWCNKCECLTYWDGSRAPGPCAADGGRHDFNGSSYYSVEHDTEIAGGQPGWRWCRQCESMVFSTTSPAPCPGGAGRPHSFGTTDYVIRLDGTGPNEQNDWKRCRLCKCLVHWNASGQQGRCQVADRHDLSETGNYSVPYAWSAPLGLLAHETGHVFGLDHGFGPDRFGDIANDNRPGAYGDWTDIMGSVYRVMFPLGQFTPAGCGLNAPTLQKLGWVNDSEIVKISSGTGTQTITLAPLYSATSGRRMVQVIRPSNNRIYTASYRPATGWDRGFGMGRVVVHAQRTLYSAGQDSWFHCSNCEGMIYGGTMRCPAGGLHDGSGSGDYSLLHGVGSSDGQSNWRWCSKCEGLAFAGNATNGSCPAGGGHNFGQTDYTVASSGEGQSNWRWCNKCQGLTFAGNAMKGACPVGGWHDQAGSGNYILGTGSGANRQNKWRHCSKCQGLFYAGRGSCAGGVHQPSGHDYSLALDIVGANGQRGWKWCSKCGGLAFYDGSRAVGSCPGGGSHEHPSAGVYTLPTNIEARHTQRHWSYCAPPNDPPTIRRCGAIHYVDPTDGPGGCFASGSHNPAGEYEIAQSTTEVVGENRFRWCSRCKCMVLGDNPIGCYDRTNHNTGTTPYVVRTEPTTLSTESAFFRTCSKCNILIMVPRPDYPAPSCPMGGTHEALGEYFLTIRHTVEKWRWCRRCELLAYWDGSREPGLCPRGGRHDHSGSDFYSPPRFTEPVQLVSDNLQAGGRYDVDIGGTTFEVISISPDSATVRVTT